MRRFLVVAIAAAGLIAMIAAPVVTGDGARKFEAKLDGYAEVPAVSTTGRGSFSARLHPNGQSLTFKLTFRDLSGPPTQAHIHFGAPATSGGISIWLCGQVPPATPNNPTQPANCPLTDSGEVSATVFPANVVGPDGQGIALGEWNEVVRALRSGVTYANVHTVKHGPGEIRGRITRSGD